jgi:hypothetical protein
MFQQLALMVGDGADQRIEFGERTEDGIGTIARGTDRLDGALDQNGEVCIASGGTMGAGTASTAVVGITRTSGCARSWTRGRASAAPCGES